MNRNKNKINYVTVELKKFTKYLISYQEEPILQLDIKLEYQKEFEKFLTTHDNISTISKSNLKSSILRYLNYNWLVPSKNFDYKRSIVFELFISYFSDTHQYYGFEVNDSLFLKNINKYKDCTDVKDEELLYCLIDIVFFNEENIIKLNSINGNFFSMTQEEYKSILDLLKKRFGITTTGIVDIDDLLQESVDKFLSSLLCIDEYKISELSYLSQDYFEFKDKLLDMILNTKDIEASCKEIFYIKGYMIEFKGSYENISLSLFPLTVISVYQGLPPVDNEYKKVLEFKGDKFWELAWGELARKHEERLLLCNNNQKMEMGAKCSDKYDATLGEIRAVVAKNTGVILTESTYGQITKSALKKIKEEFKKRGICYEDYAEFLHECNL